MTNQNARDILERVLDDMTDEIRDIHLEREAERAITGDSHLPHTEHTPTVLITGGSNGIGRGMAFAFAEAGYDVCITYHSDREPAEVIKDYIENQMGRSCEIVHVDMASVKRVDTMIKRAVDLMGHIDVLINNAGLTQLDEAYEAPDETLDTLYEVNFRGPLIAQDRMARYWKEHGQKGSIIHISSIHADTIYVNDAAYGGLKAGLERAMKTAALQYGNDGIRVNAIAPGAILIPRTDSGHEEDEMRDVVPLRRSGLPRDIAHAALFLASERASYITGISILIDGGMALANPV